MTPEECKEIIAQFQRDHQFVVRSRGVHGVAVRVENDVPELHVWVLPGEDRANLRADEIPPPVFEYIYEGTRKTIVTKTVNRRPASFHDHPTAVTERSRSALVLPGDIAQPAGAAFYGTAGWNIILDQIPVCISNWHVLCPQGNDTPLNSRILLAGQNIASLYFFNPMIIGNPGIGPSYNTWDYALAKYDDPNDMGDTMRPCGDGSVRPYPRALSTGFNFGDMCFKVGARSPTCRQGRVTTVGSFFVTYDNLGSNFAFWFNNQLVFDKMSDPGDSGAVIVKEADNTVLALNFAGSDDSTIGNPIYEFDWSPTGIWTTRDGREFPMFERAASLIAK